MSKHFALAIASCQDGQNNDRNENLKSLACTTSYILLLPPMNYYTGDFTDENASVEAR